MKSIRFRLLLAALAVMLGAAIAKSQTADTPTSPAPLSHPHAFGMHEPIFGFFAKQLDLTDEQRAQMRTAIHNEHSTMKPLFQQLRQMHQQLKQYEEGAFDQVKVQALVQAQSQTLVQLRVEEVKLHSELYQLLTPEQQTKLKDLEAQHEARMQQHMQGQQTESPEKE